jgi:voltage-gated potassium channel
MKKTIGFLDRLYHGESKAAIRFRFALLAVDLATITFFVVLSMAAIQAPWVIVLNYAIAVYLIADLTARGLIRKRLLLFLVWPTTIADILVVISLLLAPFVQSLAFLRLLRALRLLQSYHMARDLRRI